MSYTTGLEMILDIERELRDKSTAHAWAVERPHRQASRHSLRALPAALGALARRVRTERLGTAAPSSSITVACCA